MFYIGAPKELAIFQAFPIYVWALRELYILVAGGNTLQVKPNSPKNEKTGKEVVPASSEAWSSSNDGYTGTLRAHLLIAHLSTYIHIQYILVPILRHAQPLSYIHELFVPSLSPPSSLITTAMSASHHFLKWDLIMIIGSAFLAGIWDFDLGTKLKAIAWFVVATPILSPGTALAGVWAYREKVLKDMRGV